MRSHTPKCSLTWTLYFLRALPTFMAKCPIITILATPVMTTSPYSLERTTILTKHLFSLNQTKRAFLYISLAFLFYICSKKKTDLYDKKKSIKYFRNVGLFLLFVRYNRGGVPIQGTASTKRCFYTLIHLNAYHSCAFALL